jgi:antitoxin component of RelBE/YafQ-DinJ toxin-antitoxin module
MPKSAKRLDRIEFRASDEDRELAEQLAAQYDLSVSDLIRVLLKQATQRSLLFPNQSRSLSKVKLLQLADLYRQLGAIHTVLDQVRKSNNMCQPETSIVVSVTLLDELDEVIKKIQNLIVQIDA